MSNKTQDTNQNFDSQQNENKNKTFKKEPLSFFTIKLLLLILIFTTLVAIIISSVYIAQIQYENVTNNKVTKTINQKTENYYDILEKRCNGNSCCLSSLKFMRENNYKEVNKDYKCSDGFKAGGLRCITSYNWCKPIKTARTEIDTIFDYIELYLKNNKQIIEIKSVPNFNIPKDIDEIQIKKYFQIGDIYFAFVCRANMNSPISSDSKFSGILTAKSEDTEWQKFFEIKNLDGAKNNPLLFGNEKEKLFLAVVDAKGAGSGEGIMKLIASDDFGKTWQLDRCFYYGVYACLPKSFSDFDKKDCIDNESIFNDITNEFEINQFNKSIGKQELIIDKNCKNIDLKTNNIGL